jgi:hypothetical protein
MRINLACLITGVIFQAMSWYASMTAVSVQEQNCAAFVGFFALLLTVCGIVCVIEDTKTNKK